MFFDLKHEVRVSRKNPRHQGSRASKGIKSRRIRKMECDQALFQEIFVI